jgi:3-phosphoshikimate 1-carboxyvinyltransferase
MTLDESNEETIAEMALDMPVRFDAQQRVWLGDEDISLAIRSEEAGMNASRVSALPAVRTALVDLQLSFQALPGLVADGRDMGTVIFPHAPLKVYLWASAQCRAERRYKQLISKGISANMSTLLADLEARDARDMNRSTAPLKPAEDSLQLDSSEMTIEEVVAQVLSWWQERQPFGRS